MFAPRDDIFVDPLSPRRARTLKHPPDERSVVTGECTYCGQDLSLHAPVFVEETVDGERVPVGGFCNYACLANHVEEAGLTTGGACDWSPG